jgi:hypothetical protein
MNPYSKPIPGTLARMKVPGMSAEAVAKADAPIAVGNRQSDESNQLLPRRPMHRRLTND